MSDQNFRKFSNWIHLRDFHNAVKYKLLESVVEYYNEQKLDKLSLLDVSVGKGGDIFKWTTLGIEYAIGLDPSEPSIDEAKQRFSEIEIKPDYNFIHTPADKTAISTEWSERNNPLLERKLFDIVSCQMTLHYFFRSQEILENAIKNISNSLLPGGIFIGTAIDEKKLIEYNKKGVFKYYKTISQSDLEPINGRDETHKDENISQSDLKPINDRVETHKGENISQSDLKPINDRVETHKGENIHRPLIFFDLHSKDKCGVTPSYSLTWGDKGEVANYMKKKKAEQSKNLDLDLEYLVNKKIFIKICEKYNLYPVKIGKIDEFQSFEKWYKRLVEDKENIKLWKRKKDINLKSPNRKHELLMSFMYESFVFIKKINLLETSN